MPLRVYHAVIHGFSDQLLKNYSETLSYQHNIVKFWQLLDPEILILNKFQKIFKNTNCRDPKFLSSFAIRGRLSQQLDVIVIIF